MKKSQPLTAASKYSQIYTDSKITTYSLSQDIQDIPIIIQSLTSYIRPEIEEEFEELQRVAQSMVNFTTYGRSIINKYKDAPDVLVQSMVNVMNDIVEGFQFIINEMISKDDDIETWESVMFVSLVLLIIFSIIIFIFIPIYYTFYYLRNGFDQYLWTVKMMKGWLIVAASLGILFSLLLFAFLYANLILSSGCYYANELISAPGTFIQNHQNDLNLENEKIIRIVNNCFLEEKSNFEFYFNENGEINRDADVI